MVGHSRVAQTVEQPVGVGVEYRRVVDCVVVIINVVFLGFVNRRIVPAEVGTGAVLEASEHYFIPVFLLVYRLSRIIENTVKNKLDKRYGSVGARL